MTIENETNETGLEIAVIGMAGRFPQAKNIEEYWENLKNGICSLTFLSDEDIEELQIDSKLLKDPNYVRAKGGVLEDPGIFDASFFGYIPAEAVVMPPQVRALHEVTWHGLEDAGYNPDDYDGLIGLYAAASTSFNWQIRTILSGAARELGQFSANHFMSKDYLTSLISYRLNLKGPNLSLHTACSSSLVAIDIACRALLTGICDIALAGATTLYEDDKVGYTYTEGLVRSSDGYCRAFDSEANGAVEGEGVGIVALKRLDDAIADRDHIYAVIKGFATNNDGRRKAGFTAPSIDAQVEVIRAARQMADVEFESIGYIETHGTGTPLGDPIEVEALRLAFSTDQKHFCGIGSVKTNIGHLDVTAGVAAFIKTVLALTHRQLPPSLFFKKPNPEIDFDNSPFYVVSELKEWENHAYPLRAGVSSFGIGGTNAHLILEEWPPARSGIHQKKPSQPNGYQLILLSAQNQSALDQMRLNLASFFKKNPGVNLADASYTLQTGRKAFQLRSMSVCSPDNPEEIINALSSQDSRRVLQFVSKKESPHVVFVFSGLGSQYKNMGLELYQKEPVFREEMDRCFEILNSLLDYDIKNILYPGLNNPSSDFPPGTDNRGGISDQPQPGSNGIHKTEISQPALFIFEYALARLFMEWGIEPRAMIGYSFGEYTAACLSGVFSLEDALKIIVLRSRLIGNIPTGTMLSVPLPIEEIEPLLSFDLSIAIDNGPSCIIAGPPEAVNAFEKKMKEKKYLCMRLQTSHAVHSKMMLPVLKEFEEGLRRITMEKPKIPYISNVSGSWITDDEATAPAYWSNHIIETVKFAAGIKKLRDDLDPIFIEVGPGNDSSGLIRRHLDKNSEYKAINTIRPPQKDVDDLYYLLDRIGRLWIYGVKINWSAFHARERHRISLPPYPFKGQKYWLDVDFIKASEELLTNQAESVPNPHMPDWFYIPAWEQSILYSYETLETLKPSNWLIFLDESGLGTRLVKRLEQYGQQVITLRAGNEYIKENDHAYIIPPGQGDGWDKLFSELRESNRIPGRILNLWNVANGDGDGTNLDEYDKYQDLGLYSLLGLVRAVGRQMITDDIQLTVVTDNMHKITGEERLCPWKSTIVGAVKIIPLEYMNIKCRSVDILVPEPGSSSEMKLIENLLTECMTSPLNDIVVAYRGIHRWEQNMKRHRLESPVNGRDRLKNRGVYLITGGFGGMGFTIAEHLSGTYKARLILVGRSAFPDRENWDEWLKLHDPQDKISVRIKKIREFEVMGAEIMAFSADISDYNRMREVIATAKKQFGPINGILHTAGLGDYEGVIQRRTREMTEKIMAPKVMGTLVLNSILKDENLDFIVLFSSIGNVLYRGKFGQVGYNAANEFLEFFADYKAADSHTFITTINWTDWLEVGMSIEGADILYKGQEGEIDYESTSIDWLQPAEGVEVFLRVLENNLHRVTVSPKELDAIIKLTNRAYERGIKGNREEGETGKGTLSPGEVAQRPLLSADYIHPGNETEQMLADLFQEFFGIHQVGIRDDFFELGGDSLKAMILSAKIHKKFNVVIPLELFFSSSTIEELAIFIRNAEKREYSPIKVVEKKEYYPVSQAQKRIYIWEQLERGKNLSYNQQIACRLEGKLDRKNVEEALGGLVSRHESLRTSFEMIDDEPVQRIHEDMGFEIEYYDLATGDTADTGEITDPFENFVRPFDLSGAPLLRARLVKEDERKHIFMLDIHHIISDGISINTLTNEFHLLYTGKQLAPLELHYKDFSLWQNKNLDNREVITQEKYWLKRFEGDIPLLDLPTDFPRSDMQSLEGDVLEFQIDRELTAGMKQVLAKTETTLYILLLAVYNMLLSFFPVYMDNNILYTANKTETTLYILLLAVYNILLSIYTGKKDIIVGSPVAGRKHESLQNLVGMFVNMLVMRNCPDGNKTFRDFLNEVKENSINAFDNQDYQFDELIDKLGLERSMHRYPLLETVFNLQNTAIDAPDGTGSEEEDESSGIVLYPYSLEKVTPIFDLMLDAFEVGEHIKMCLTFSTELFNASTIEKIKEHYIEILEQVTTDLDVKLEDIKISHEFVTAASEILKEEKGDFGF